MNNETTVLKTSMDTMIRKLRLFVSVLVGLYVVFVVVSTIHTLTEFESMIIFGSVLGATVFVFYLMLGVELKKRKRLEN